MYQQGGFPPADILIWRWIITGSNFLAYVKQVFKRTDKDTEIYTATADTVMDMRARLLSDEHMSVSSALSGISSVGDYTLTLPTDFGHLIGDVLIRDTAADDVYSPLRKISKEEFDLIYQDNLASTAANRNTGTPTDYAYFGQQIYIGPAVDHTNYEFKINYTTEDTPTITGSTDPVPFTDQFREHVRAGVLSRMFREMENYAEADVWLAEYERGLVKIEANDRFNAAGSEQGIAFHGI